MNRRVLKYIGPILVIVEFCFLFLTYKSYAYKDVDKVEENSNISKEMFAMYKEVKEGEYEEVTDTETFPLPGYSFNIEKSNCIDRKGNLVEGILSSDNTSVTVTSNKTVFCYVYFDIIPKGYAIYSATDNSLTFYNDKNTNLLSVGDTYNNKAVTAIYKGIETSSYTTSSAVPWSGYATNIKSVEVKDEIKPISLAYWFYGLTNTSTLDLENINTSNVTDMSYAFQNTGYNVQTFKTDLSEWNTGNVIYMYSTFKNTGYKATTFDIGDISNWNVQKLKALEETFWGSGHDSTEWYIGDLSSWKTISLTSLYSSFREAGSKAASVNLDLSNWDVSKVTHMGSTFQDFGRNSSEWSVGDLSNWNTKKVTSMLNMFRYTGTNASVWDVGDISNWDVSKVTNMGNMFLSSGESATEWNVGTFSNWNTSNVKNMQYMFAKAGYKSTKIELDLSKWNVSNVTNMHAMFAEFGHDSKSISIGDISGWNTANVVNMQNMFNTMGYYASYKLNLSNWDVSKVVNYSNFNANATSKITAPTWVNENIYIEETE